MSFAESYIYNLLAPLLESNLLEIAMAPLLHLRQRLRVEGRAGGVKSSSVKIPLDSLIGGKFKRRVTL